MFQLSYFFLLFDLAQKTKTTLFIKFPFKIMCKQLQNNITLNVIYDCNHKFSNFSALPKNILVKNIYENKITTREYPTNSIKKTGTTIFCNET